MLIPGAVASQRGGGLSVPSSVLELVTPSSFTFTGGTLDSVTPDIDDGGTITVVGSPAEGANGGYEMTEASGTANYVSYYNSRWNTTFPSGIHLAMVFRRNGVADTETILVGSTSDSRYALACQDGSGSGTTAQSLAVSQYHTISGQISSPNRDLLHTEFIDTLNVKRSVSLYDVANGNHEVRFGYYGLSAWHLEGEILGWALYDDNNQTTDVLQYLEDVTT